VVARTAGVASISIPPELPPGAALARENVVIIAVLLFVVGVSMIGKGIGSF
jgi:hypothetical protein